MWLRGARRPHGVRDVPSGKQQLRNQADGTARAIRVGRPRLVGETIPSRKSQRSAHEPASCLRGSVAEPSTEESSRFSAGGCQIGKAGPKGGRTGAFNAEYDVPKLAGRIGDHYESVQEAQNLRTNNFTFTYLKLQKPFIEFAETALINEYRPWWNSYITGLGNHDVGANRSGSEQSMWDTFHPGRYFVQKRSLVPRGTQKQVSVLHKAA